MTQKQRQPNKRERARFHRACEMLASLTKNTGFNLYLAEDQMHLMTGDSHDLDGTRRRDLSAEDHFIPRASGGDW